MNGGFFTENNTIESHKEQRHEQAIIGTGFSSSLVDRVGGKSWKSREGGGMFLVILETAAGAESMDVPQEAWDTAFLIFLLLSGWVLIS